MMKARLGHDVVNGMIHERSCKGSSQTITFRSHAEEAMDVGYIAGRQMCQYKSH